MEGKSSFFDLFKKKLIICTILMILTLQPYKAIAGSLG